MASTGTATGPQKADGTVQQPEAAAGVDSQQSGAQFRQEGASLSETGQAAGIKGSGSTAAEPGLGRYMESAYPVPSTGIESTTKFQ